MNKDLMYLLELPIEEVTGICFDKNTLFLDNSYEIECVVTKPYRLRVFYPDIRFELQLTPNKVRVNKLFSAKNSGAVYSLSEMYDDDELMLKYTNFQVDKQADNHVILIDYNVEFKKDYLFEIGTRKDIKKPMLLRYNNLNLTLYDEIMFSNVGSELSVVDMTKVKEDMHNDIVHHCCSESTIFTKGIWLLKRGNDAIERFMELSSTYFHINVYDVSTFPKEVQTFILNYINVTKKDIDNFFVKSLLLKPDIVEFLRTHNGIWYL